MNVLIFFLVTFFIYIVFLKCKENFLVCKKRKSCGPTYGTYDAIDTEAIYDPDDINMYMQTYPNKILKSYLQDLPFVENKQVRQKSLMWQLNNLQR